MFVFTAQDNIINLKVIHEIYIKPWRDADKEWEVVFNFDAREPYRMTCKDREHAETIIRKLQGCIIGGHPWCKITEEETGMGRKTESDGSNNE